MFVLILIFLFCLPGTLLADSISLDLGQTKTAHNRFAIPNTSADRVSLPQGDKVTTYRVTAYLDLAEDSQLYVLLAPLETDYTFVADKDFTFDGVNFANGVETRVDYTFNSYRLGYLKTWVINRFRWWLGATGKIRDAEIAVTQGNTTRRYNNVGLVPLLTIGFDWPFYANFSLFTHTDAIWSSQGSAYDAQLELKQRFKQFSWSLGKRLLGGGVDNDKVYNMAQFETVYLRFAQHY